MEKNDIKLMWQKINLADASPSEVDVEEIIKKSHSNIILKTLNLQKKKMLVYFSFLIVYASLMIYAFVILRLNLSIQSVISLSLTGLFLFVKTIFEINGFRLLQSIKSDIAIKESIFSFKQKLNHVKMVEFISTLIYCYGWAIGIVWVVINDFNGLIKSLLPLLIFLILILLIIPWYIKYFRPQYKNLYTSLDKDIEFLKSK
ncbi:hypothetical protein [uncultured Dysgonomonas sp.]|uniref:Uncharacterized protein n=1 Tax=uncultured Dysgonomonas sp. TaxID=206096 RepID=A0A212J2V2_9BACT|nr:hypothetical protein [uncultured Dysgonomonas sp.]SBV93788.1 conserved membrane hypothetical protein [uncultured Dysgonomonas sp.]